MDKVVAAVERFRRDMELAGIRVSGFEVADDLQRQKLEAMGAPFIVTRTETSDRSQIAGLGFTVKEPRS